MVRKDRLIACAVSQSANHGSYAPHDGFDDESNPEPHDLLDRRSRYRQIKITVIGRKSGKTISNPVWFVAEGDTLYLLPVHGSNTQWYKNVLKNPAIRIEARGSEAELRAKPINKSNSVKSVIEKFRESTFPQ
jgi:deazaflavin-dependent oxidoreductase (nitroreductase family)